MKLRVVDDYKEYECRPKYKLEEIIRVCDYGQVYDYYRNAFKYFGISYICPSNLKYLLNGCMTLTLPRTTSHFFRENAKWKIIGIALHNDGKTILYCIVSTKHLALIIGEEGLAKIKN